MRDLEGVAGAIVDALFADSNGRPVERLYLMSAGEMPVGALFPTDVRAGVLRKLQEAGCTVPPSPTEPPPDDAPDEEIIAYAESVPGGIQLAIDSLWLAFDAMRDAKVEGEVRDLVRQAYDRLVLVRGAVL